jgi:hypothetical protein
MRLHNKSAKGFTRRDFIKMNVATALALNGVAAVIPANASVSRQVEAKYSLVFGREMHEQPFTVMVSISADDNLKSKITNYINQELKALDDVILAEKYPCFYEIEIKASRQENGPGNPATVTLSTIFLHRADMESFKKILMSELSKENLLGINTSLIIDSSFAGFINTWGYIHNVKNHYLETVSEDQLQDLCKRIVVDFDNDCFVPIRVVRKFYKDIISKKNNSN